MIRPNRRTPLVFALGLALATPAGAQVVDLDALAGGGIRMDSASDSYLGISVSGAGDVNGDGLSDLIVQAVDERPEAAGSAARIYVVFGREEGGTLDLAALGDDGFSLLGGYASATSTPSRTTVSGAGDVNGDGLDDLIVGAPFARTSTGSLTGVSFVVFGRRSGGTVELEALGSGGFKLEGALDGDLGVSVAGAGDVNGDGLSDVVVGVERGNNDGYLIFGKTDSTTVDVGALGTGGMTLLGSPTDLSSFNVSGAGDVNGDGLSDFVVGVPSALSPAGGRVGAAYVVFGSPLAPYRSQLSALKALPFAVVLLRQAQVSPYPARAT